MDQQLTDPGDDVWFLHDDDTGDRLAVAIRPRRSEDGIALPEDVTSEGDTPAPQRPTPQLPSPQFPSLRGRRVLVIGINYSPEPTGIAPYTTAVAEQLAQHAAAVTVLTGLPHYPSWSVPEAYRDARRIEEPHEPGEPRVIRLRHHVPSTQTALTRARYELTFLLHAWREAKRLSPRPDLIVCATPALGGAVAAARLARRLDVPCITIVQDLMAKAAAQSGIQGGRGLVQRATAALEGYALRRSRRVAVVADAFRPAVEAYGVAAERIDLLPNWTHVQASDLTRDEARRALGWSPTAFIAAHTGNIGLKQDLGSVVDAARVLPPASPVEVLIIGDGSQRAAIDAQADGAAKVRLMPPLSEQDYPVALAAADVLLVNERPSIGDMSLPSKLTSYLAAGRPVLAAVSADGATAAELRRTDGAGQLVEPGDPTALASALEALRRDPARCRVMAARAAAYAGTALGARQSMAKLADSVLTALPTTPRALRSFTPDGYDKGRGKLWQVAWFVVLNLIFSAWWCPARLRPAILRAFGARVGKRVLIRHRVRVLWPWKLTIGDDCWIGEDAWLLNLEPITLEHDVCLSQGAFLCTGSHDHRDVAFGYDNAPIHIGAGAWVAARATVLRGTRVAEGTVVPAGATARTRHPA